MHRFVFAVTLIFLAGRADAEFLALAPASVTLTSSSNPAVYGQSLTLTAGVTPSTATGTVTFYDGSVILGVAPLNGGAAILKTCQALYGNTNLKAHYSGDVSHTPATGTLLPQTVAAISSSGFPTFNPNATPENVNFVATGDFNGDGKLDIVLTMVDQIIVLLGKGDGTFLQGPAFSAGNVTSVTSVAVGDFNGDGFLDLAVSDYGDVTPGSPNYVWILLGYGNGQFRSPVSFPVGCAPVVIQVADVNSDGAADLVAVGSALGTSDISVLMGNGDGTFRSAVNYSTANFAEGAIAFTIGDFNGDQVPDLAVLDTDLSILLGRGDGTFNPAVEYATGNTPIGIATGDFNRDGITDLVIANNVDGTVSILLGAGNGSFEIQTRYPVQPVYAFAYPSSVTVGDFNGDNISDVAVANYEDGQNSLISIMLGTGTGTLQSPITYPGGAGAEILVQGDFNGDGAIDLAVADGNGSDGAGDVGVLISNRCFFGVSAPPLNFDANGGTSLVNIDSTAPACGWSASVNPAGWAFLSAASGFGGGSVSAVVAPNTSGAQRTGSLTVSGETLGVTQWSTVQVFSDVNTSEYYFDAVNLLQGRNITQGCSTKNYCPTTPITRAEMAVFIVRAVYGGSDNFPYSQSPYFSDVSPTDFGFKWIQHMFELGITAGCGANVFCPNATVTRAQMAVFVIRARYGSGTPFTSPSAAYFTDVPPGSFGYSWIQRLREDNITAGCLSTEYCPDSSVTRGDMAIFVMRGAFNALYPPGQPVITGISPSTLSPGSTGTFTVTALFTSFVQGSTVMVPVGGVTPSNLVVTSPTTFTVTLTAAASAPPQPCSIYVQTGSQEVVMPNGLSIP